MRAAGLLTASALQAVRAALRPGVSTLELDEIAEAVIRSGGGVPNFQLVRGYRHTICASVNSQVVHGIPSNRRLEPGDIISVDCGALLDGWNGDSAFTAVLPGGESSLRRKREELSAVTRQALYAGCAALASAENLNEIGEVIERTVRESGAFGILRDYVGHGIGRKMHEHPPVFNYRVSDPGPRIEPGLVVAIEPMLTGGKHDTVVASDGWTVETVDSSDGAHWEHTVAVHEDGIWILTDPDGGAEGLSAFGVVPIALQN
ncbi:MAG: type methionyl aminopeptidase [Actinomycetota bacterium]